MITLPVLTAFIITCIIIESTPGPNMGYLAILSLDKGRSAGISAVIGIALGLLIVGVAASMGLASVISNSPFLFQALRWGGVFYMLYLAWDSWRDTNAALDKSEARTQEKIAHGKYFRRGLIVNLLNPKAGLFYVAILPSFVTQDSTIFAQTLVLTLAFVAIATAIHSIVVMAASSIKPFLENSKRQIVVRRILAVLLAAVALWFAWDTAE